MQFVPNCVLETPESVCVYRVRSRLFMITVIMIRYSFDACKRVTVFAVLNEGSMFFFGIWTMVTLYFGISSILTTVQI